MGISAMHATLRGDALTALTSEPAFDAQSGKNETFWSKSLESLAPDRTRQGIADLGIQLYVLANSLGRLARVSKIANTAQHFDVAIPESTQETAGKLYWHGRKSGGLCTGIAFNQPTRAVELSATNVTVSLSATDPDELYFGQQCELDIRKTGGFAHVQIKSSNLASSGFRVRESSQPRDLLIYSRIADFAANTLEGQRD